jgi:hypothetical protein
MTLKIELLVGRQFDDQHYPIEADGTIVGQIRLQLALFNDEVLDDLDESLHGDVDSCTCAVAKHLTIRATKVGDVLINGISPNGVQYLEAGTVVHTGCELAGDYVMDKDYVEEEEGEQGYGGNGEFRGYLDRVESASYDDSDYEGDEL